jgi:sigma-E factor negative regulatory protein RseA
MNEELDSQLSAMFDDELPEGECELLARRLSRDPALQARWARYAAIGAAVRGEVRLGGKVARHVSAVIAGETDLVAVSVGSPRAAGALALSRTWRSLAGVAVAAGVAAVSILLVHGGGFSGSAPSSAIVASRSAPPAAAVDVPASYVVPRPTESRMIVPATELANYVVAHSEFSTPLNRPNLLSALMASEAAATGVPEQAPPPAPTGDKPKPHAEQAR